MMASRIKYYHFYSVKDRKGEVIKHGVLTVAVRLSGSYAVYGFSMCAPGERFNKQFGRDVALKRCEDYTEKFNGALTVYKRKSEVIKFQILTDILNNFSGGEKRAPKWALNLIMDNLLW